MKLGLASLAHVLGVSVAVHNHGRFVRVTADVKHDLCRTRLQNIVSVFRKVLHAECQPVRYTLFNSVSHISSSQCAVQLVSLLKTKIDRRGLTKDCLSCVHVRCGFIINTLQKKTSTGDASEKTMSILLYSAVAAVAIG